MKANEGLSEMTGETHKLPVSRGLLVGRVGPGGAGGLVPPESSRVGQLARWLSCVGKSIERRQRDSK